MVLDGNAPIHERPLRLAELPDPEPGEREIVVRVTVCAICRTDLHVVEGDLDDGGGWLGGYGQGRQAQQEDGKSGSRCR